MTIHFDDRSQLAQAREKFFAAEGDGSLPADLLKSWQRSKEALGVPANVSDVPTVSAELLDAHLLDMFQAPLSRVADSFDDTGLGLLLADAEGRILGRWAPDRAAGAQLDALGTVRGAVLAETVVGTNGVGTVAATGRSVQISGAEHFADIYRDAMCTGVPIKHPVTGKLLAVVTISGDIADRNALLRPLIQSVRIQLEQQVLEFEQPASRATLSAFLDAVRDGRGPVVAFGPQGVVMQSKESGSLTSHELDRMRDLFADGRRSGRRRIELSDREVPVEVTAIGDGDGVVVVLGEQPRATGGRPSSPVTLRPQLVGRSGDWLSVIHQVTRHRAARHPVVVAGEPGVGKTSVALGVPYRHPAANAGTVIDAAERHVSGSRKWLQRLSDTLDGGEPVVIRGIETLDQQALAGMRSLIESSTGGGVVVLTVTAESPEAADAFGGRMGMPTFWLPSLRDRSADAPMLWNHFAETIAPGAGLRPGPDTVELLRSYRWPGNLTELRGTVEQMAMKGKRGTVYPSDLPAAMQGARSLSMIERAELDAIRRALEESGGNRSKAAEILGLSRATIYRKMKAYRITP